MANEINRILKLFADLQDGDCWIGTNCKEVLFDVDAEQAAKKVNGYANSIWMLVAHVTYWRNVVVIRLTGSSDPPGFSDFLLPENCNEESWRQTLQDFDAAYILLRNNIQDLNAKNLYTESPRKGQTFYELLLGCLQHDAYHLGQMVLLKKTF